MNMSHLITEKYATRENTVKRVDLSAPNRRCSTTNAEKSQTIIRILKKVDLRIVRRELFRAFIAFRAGERHAYHGLRISVRYLSFSSDDKSISSNLLKCLIKLSSVSRYLTRLFPIESYLRECRR